MVIKKSILYFIFLSIFLCLTVHAEVIDKIVIVVNNEFITQGEIDRIVLPMYYKLKSQLSGQELIKRLDEFRQSVVNQLIDEKLVLSEAKKQAIEVYDKEVDAKIAEAEKRFPSKDVFEKALAAEHMSIKDLRQRYKEQLMTKKLIDQKVGARVFITPSDVAEYYKAHIDDYTQPASIKVSNILVKFKDGINPQKTAELTAEISKRLKEGSDFAELARIYSEGPAAEAGGEMGYVNKGDLMPEIESVIYGMKPGEISDPIKTSLGYHFFKIEDKKDASVTNLDDARKQIEEILYTERMKEKSKGWINDLRKYAYIAFK